MYLKLRYYNDSSMVKRLASKALAREYIHGCGLDEILLECYGIWDAIEDIPWEALPEQFILKTAMGCGSHVICRDRRLFCIDAAKKKLRENWSSRAYLLYSEMQYKPSKNVRQQVLCERLLDTESGGPPDDIKIYCYHGEPKYVLYCFDRDADGHAKFMMFDTDWNYMPQLTKNRYDNVPERPHSFPHMLAIARVLSKSLPFVRVDLYEEHGKPIFGELTFTPSGGLDDDYTEEGQKILGEPLDIRYIDREVLK